MNSGFRYLCWTAALGLAAAAGAADAPKTKLFLAAEKAELNKARVEVIARPAFDDGRGVMLQAGVEADFDRLPETPDVTFRFTIKEPGRYWIETVADTSGATRERMKTVKNKYESPLAVLSIDGGRPIRRVIMFPWKSQDSFKSEMQKHTFTAGEHRIGVWLPAGVGLDRMNLIPYRAPELPAKVEDYRPETVPPAGHPRVWVTKESLPGVRANLDRGENREVWEKVKKDAAKPFKYDTDAATAFDYNPGLQQAAVKKAFVALMTGDRAAGREAIELTAAYLDRVEFGNMLGETRGIGLAIYSGALVYDWCCDLATADERRRMRDGMLRLAEDMEMGWPPFLQNIVNGHGNEEQLNRDFLAMSIALYDEDPEPYRICAYRLFEELIPMRAFEYRCHRHNQGISYGSWRLGCELHAAWMLKRMAGRELFDPGIKDVYYYWIYGRQTGRDYIVDGDSNPGAIWNLPRNALLNYTYAADPIIKGDFERLGREIFDPVIFLLINDPALKPEPKLDALPLSHHFEEVLPAMIARTGWNLAADSDDVIVEMKGGGYGFDNHQHADAGSFQIYHRGVLTADLGRYKFYGTPYDMSYNKRSIAHNVMLVRDPDETFDKSVWNDGGQRTIPKPPDSLKSLTSDPRFRIGATLGAGFGPDRRRPFYTYLQSDLRPAYSGKVTDYVRTFCFLRFESTSTPAALIVVDRIGAAKPEFKKYWLFQTPTPPEPTPDGWLVKSADGKGGKLYLQMLAPADCEVESASGDDLYRFFGCQVEPPVDVLPAASSCRTMFSPKQAAASDLFVAVMTVGDPLPVTMAKADGLVRLTVGDRVVVLNPAAEPRRTAFRFSVPRGGPARQTLLAGLAPGVWKLRGAGGRTLICGLGEGTLFAELAGGDYEASPEEPANP